MQDFLLNQQTKIPVDSRRTFEFSGLHVDSDPSESVTESTVESAAESAGVESAADFYKSPRPGGLVELSPLAFWTSSLTRVGPMWSPLESVAELVDPPRFHPGGVCGGVQLGQIGAK